MGALLSSLIQLTPIPVKRLFVRMMRRNAKSSDGTELEFQEAWAQEFSANPLLTLEYWNRYRFLTELRRFVSVGEGSRVLDVGCGISTVLHFVEGRRYGVDVLAESYGKLYTYPQGITLIAASGEAIPFFDNSFDLIFCSNVLDHIDHPERAVAEIHRVLAAGGCFVLHSRSSVGDKTGTRFTTTASPSRTSTPYWEASSSVCSKASRPGSGFAATSKAGERVSTPS